MSRASLLAAGLLTAIWGSAHPALAAQLSFSCEELDAGRPAQMTLTYEGDESGTLKLNACSARWSYERRWRRARPRSTGCS